MFEVDHDTITVSDGGGGRRGIQLVEHVFLEAYGNDILNKLEDAAELNLEGKRIAFTTDSFTVKPVFFPGGDIGKLAVCGTLNDLAVQGARPLALSAAFIIEEGFSKGDLKTIADSMHQTASELAVPIVTGDTKVVSRGEADGIFISTSGIGVVMNDMHLSVSGAHKGDDIIATGTLADHGIAIMNAREKLDFSPPLLSDAAPVFHIVDRIASFGKHIHVMRDPTRGGVAGILNEIAMSSQVTITVSEEGIPIKKEVMACCDLLGIDPLYLANEGKIVLFVDPQATPEILQAIKNVPLGKDAVVIGRVTMEEYSKTIPPVSLETRLGTKRFIPLLESDPLPRIC